MYTNIVNISDSILFLTSCRLAIKESVLVNEELDAEDKYGLVDFVMNEASDYQIMSIIVDDEYVEEKYSLEDEVDLFDRYKAMVVDNIYEFAGVLESEDLKSLLYEVGPVSQEGISTATPILEFLYESGVIQEKGKMKKLLTGTTAAAKKGASAAKKGASAASGAAKSAGSKVAQVGKNAAFDAQVKARGLKKSIPHRAKGIAKTAGEKTAPARAAVAKGAKAVAGAPGKAVQKAKDVAFDAQFKARGLKKSVPHHLKGLKAHAKDVGGAAAGLGGTVKKAAMSNKKTAGAAALGAAAIYGGVKAYKRFMTQAGRQCAGQSGAAKDACIAKVKSAGLKAQIATTQRGMSACANSKNPEKCRAAIQNRVAKLKTKMAKVAA